MKLGKRPAKQDPRTLKLARYVDLAKLPARPLERAWSAKAGPYPMYDNDRIGDCGPAGIAHQIQVWTGADAVQVTPTLAQVIEFYQHVGKYQPGNPASDNGVVMLDALVFWRNFGFAGGSHRIAAFAEVDPRDGELVRQAINLFGGLSIGVLLPQAVEGQSNDVEWDAPSRVPNHGPWSAGSWGGHWVQLVDYRQDGSFNVITWGGVKRMTLRFLQAYCDEMYAALGRDWLGKDNKAPNGFDVGQLAGDLARV